MAVPFEPPGPFLRDLGVSFDVEVRCRGKALIELVGRDQGFVLTDAGELIAVGAQARVLPAMDGAAEGRRLALAAAAALDRDGVPVLGTVAKQVAWFRGGGWEVKSHEAAVLALAGSPAGVVAGDAAGAITVFDGRRLPWLHAGEAVVELRDCGEHLGVLGAGGGVWLTRWPGDEAGVLKPIETGRIGRAFGLFSAGGGKLGVFGSRRAGVIDPGRGRIVAASLELGEIRAVVAHEDGAGYVVLGDGGELTRLDATLRSGRAIGLPSQDAAIGVRAAAEGALLAWTSAGELFHLRPDGRARRLASGGVRLAYPVSRTTCVAVDASPGGLRLHSESWS